MYVVIIDSGNSYRRLALKIIGRKLVGLILVELENGREKEKDEMWVTRTREKINVNSMGTSR